MAMLDLALFMWLQFPPHQAPAEAVPVGMVLRVPAIACVRPRGGGDFRHHLDAGTCAVALPEHARRESGTRRNAVRHSRRHHHVTAPDLRAGSPIGLARDA
jgi:hypothetical protein